MPKINRLPIKKQKENFLAALAKTLGILTPALSSCRLSYHTYAKWFKEDEQFRKDCIEIDQLQGDFVENKLLELIGEGNPTAVIFYLKCRRHEKWNDHSNQVNVNVTATEFQIGSSNNSVGLIDTKEIKMIENES